METRVKGVKELFEEVINTGLCTLCGACAGSCPYLMPYKGRIALVDNCSLSEGQCYHYCPRTHVDFDAISQRIFGEPYSQDELGTSQEVLMVRSTDVHIKERAQYGGTITTLLTLALEEGLIDSAILARMFPDRTSKPFLARNPDDVFQCAGSNYMAVPVLEALNHVPEDSQERLGIVATPCQALALAKMKNSHPQNRADIGNVRLTIGLFCTWALSPDGFYRFLKETLDPTDVKKFDIPPPPANRFDVYTSSRRISLPLDRVREVIMPTCAYCLDMTSEFADISVGAAEGIQGWNTVIVRTDVGAELMQLAKARGKVETDALPPQNLAHLKEAALLKKKRAVKEIIQRSGDKGNLLYLGLSESTVSKLLS